MISHKYISRIIQHKKTGLLLFLTVYPRNETMENKTKPSTYISHIRNFSYLSLASERGRESAAKRDYINCAESDDMPRLLKLEEDYWRPIAVYPFLHRQRRKIKP